MPLLGSFGVDSMISRLFRGNPLFGVPSSMSSYELRYVISCLGGYSALPIFLGVTSLLSSYGAKAVIVENTNTITEPMPRQKPRPRMQNQAALATAIPGNSIRKRTTKMNHALTLLRVLPQQFIYELLRAPWKRTRRLDNTPTTPQHWRVKAQNGTSISFSESVCESDEKISFPCTVRLHTAVAVTTVSTQAT